MSAYMHGNGHYLPSCVPEQLPLNILPRAVLWLQRSHTKWRRWVTIYPQTVGPGCPVSSSSQASSQLCYPHLVFSVRILKSLLWEGRLSPTPAPCCAHPSNPCRCPGSYAFTSSRNGPLQQPEVTFRKPFLPRELHPKGNKRQCKPCSFAPSTTGRW